MVLGPRAKDTKCIGPIHGANAISRYFKIFPFNAGLAVENHKMVLNVKLVVISSDTTY